MTKQKSDIHYWSRRRDFFPKKSKPHRIWFCRPDSLFIEKNVIFRKAAETRLRLIKVAAREWQAKIDLN